MQIYDIIHHTVVVKQIKNLHSFSFECQCIERAHSKTKQNEIFLNIPVAYIEFDHAEEMFTPMSPNSIYKCLYKPIDTQRGPKTNVYSEQTKTPRDKRPQHRNRVNKCQSFKGLLIKRICCI